MKFLKHVLVVIAFPFMLAQNAGPAHAVTGFSLTFEPAATSPGGSFTALLRGGMPGDFLLSLDSLAEFDGGKVSFVRYETTGTLTQGFSGPLLASPYISLIEPGTPAVEFDGLVVRAVFAVSNAAAAGPTNIRLHGIAGLDVAGDVPFDVGVQIQIAAVPEPGAWLMFLAGLGFLTLLRGRRKSST